MTSNAKEKGVKLNKLQNNKNKKKLKTKGKKIKPTLPICCLTILNTKKIKDHKQIVIKNKKIQNHKDK
jgi:hypothetical protein